MHAVPNHCSCGAKTAPTHLFEIASRTSSARSTLLRCAACGSLYPQALPTPPEVEREYDIGSADRAGWRRLARRLVDWTRRRYVDRELPCTARRVLDFGCGGGDYLARISIDGREAFGVDLIRPSAVGEAWRWIAVDDLDRFGPFDWITLGHVLEHLDDSGDVLSRLSALLAPGGGLWLATPNADSFIFCAAGTAARDVDYPRHREIFARAGLERRLRGVGIDVTWLSPPRVNAVLNVATTTGQIVRERARSRRDRFIAFARLWLALFIHLLKGRRYRDAESPELVAVCRVSSAGRSPAR
jgi:SAM-dependent methyltransferase